MFETPSVCPRHKFQESPSSAFYPERIIKYKELPAVITPAAALMRRLSWRFQRQGVKKTFCGQITEQQCAVSVRDGRRFRRLTPTPRLPTKKKEKSMVFSLTLKA